MSIDSKIQGRLSLRPSRVSLLRLVVFLFLSVCGDALFAADKLLIVHSALNLLTSPLWVAKEKGFFLKYGLDAETIYIPSGTMGMQALLGGETKILVGDGSSALNARLRGAPVKIFLGMEIGRAHV